MGYDTSTHTDEMAALKKDRITRAKARDQYLSELGGKGEAGKKAAAILRASKDSKFKSKSAAEEMYETFEKEYKKNNPTEEKKEPSPDKPTT